MVAIDLPDEKATEALAARLAAEARAGDVIALRNPSSQKVIHATVTAGGEAEMHL